MSHVHKQIEKIYQNTNSKDWHIGLETYQYINAAWRDALPTMWIATAIDDIVLFLMLNSQLMRDISLNAYNNEVVAMRKMYVHIQFAILHSSEERFEAMLRETSIYTAFMSERMYRIRFCMRMKCCYENQARMRVLARVYKEECVYSIDDFCNTSLRSHNSVFQHIVLKDDWVLYYHMLLEDPEHVHAHEILLFTQTRNYAYLEAHCRVLKQHNAVKCLKALKLHIVNLVSTANARADLHENTRTQYCQQSVQVPHKGLNMNNASVPVTSTKRKFSAAQSCQQFAQVSHKGLYMNSTSVPATSTKRKFSEITKENVGPTSEQCGGNIL